MKREIDGELARGSQNGNQVEISMTTLSRTERLARLDAAILAKKLAARSK